MKGAALEHLQLRHPFYERTVPVILGEHVTLESGTGAVHTAPGHGQDDFIVGSRYGLEVDNPVGSDGRFLPATPLFAGEKVFDANPHVVEVLRERGALLHHEAYRHSYPHCWRHKTPVIFRATPQWFISMEQAGLRAAALTEIGKVEWTPGWGQQRIYSMIAGRPDWCISRQRTWGVPLSLFTHRETGALHPRTAELLERVAELVARDGIDAWFDLDPATLLGAEAEQYEKVTDIMDVWVDSGVSHHCVSQIFPQVRTPADLYLEGSDQHRGWFHSSLLTSVAQKGHAPYRGVLTHGFTVDDKGRKMSKSLGNVILPQKVMSTLGADILRLWVAATDYANEISVSDEILKRTSDSYRRVRNTVRFLLGNLAGFDPARDAVPVGEMLALDRWAVQRTRELQQEIVAAYRSYDFHLIYQKLHNFCVVDLGGFYLDVVKDRLYTMPAGSAARRSAQTALYWIAEAMVRWLAPILSFTAEEIWRFLPGPRAESVFFTTWAELPDTTAVPQAIDWPRVLEARAAVLRELERLRVAGQIGAPLDAEVTLYGTPEWTAALAPLADELRFVLITSRRPWPRPGRDPPTRWRRTARARAASGCRSSRPRRPSACAAGTSGRTSVPCRPIRNCAAAAQSISTARARPGCTPDGDPDAAPQTTEPHEHPYAPRPRQDHSRPRVGFHRHQHPDCAALPAHAPGGLAVAVAVHRGVRPGDQVPGHALPRTVRPGRGAAGARFHAAAQHRAPRSACWPTPRAGSADSSSRSGSSSASRWWPGCGGCRAARSSCRSRWR